MRVIVAGATTWTDVEVIRRELRKLPSGVTIIHGDARGADAIAGEVAVELGFAVERYDKNEDDRQRHGVPEAWRGLNERMLQASPDLVLGFHPAIEQSKGTGHLVELASRAGIAVRVISGIEESLS